MSLKTIITRFVRRAAPMTAANDVPAPAEEPVKPAEPTLKDLFDGTGKFLLTHVFRYHVLSGPNLVNRRLAIALLRNCSKAEFMSLPFEARKAAFKFLRLETARYYGTAKYSNGRPMPRLDFSGMPNGNRHAASYREHLQAAFRNIAQHVYRSDSRQLQAVTR